MDPGFYARKLLPDDPDPALCLLDSLLVYEERATAEAHLQVLLQAADDVAMTTEVHVLRVPGRNPRATSGWRLAGREAAPTQEIRRQVAALNAAVFCLEMCSTPTLPPPGYEA